MQNLLFEHPDLLPDVTGPVAACREGAGERNSLPRRTEILRIRHLWRPRPDPLGQRCP